MPFATTTASNGLVVESELTQSTIRIYKPRKTILLFSCQVSHAGMRKARISNAQGQYNFKIRLALKHWLKLNNFHSFTFERGKPDEGQTPWEGKVDPMDKSNDN